MAHDVSLLLTRPRAASERFAQQLTVQLPTLISPLLEIRLNRFEARAADHVIFTSRNGVAAWAHNGLPVTACCYCVGAATAQAARAIGFDPIASGGTVDHLIRDIVQAAPDGTLLHVRGTHTRGALVQHLKQAGLHAQDLIAYAQDLRDLSQDARALIQGGAPVIVPLFSPRSAKQFAAQGLGGANLDIIAISRAAASECPAARVATFPNAEGMIAAIAKSPLLDQ